MDIWRVASFFTAFVVIVGIAYFIIYNYSPILFSIPQPKYVDAQIKNHTFRLEVADTDDKRKLGLSGRDSIPEDGGMIFIFDKPARYGFWMKNMKFPLDTIWLKGKQIADIRENEAEDVGLDRMPIYYPKDAVDAAIELNAGTVAKDNINVGDSFSF